MAMALRASRPRTRSRAISDTADHAAPYKAANRNAVAKTGGASGGPVLLVVQSCPVTPVGIVGEFAKRAAPRCARCISTRASGCRAPRRGSTA